MSTHTTETIAPRPAASVSARAEARDVMRNVASPRVYPVLQVLGFRFRNITLEQAASALVEDAERDIRTRVYFVNAHCVNTAARNKAYCKVLHSAEILFADGAGLALAARLWGKRFVDNVNGTDLFPLICERAVARGIPVALLGARPGVVTQCAEKLRERFPGLRIAWVRDGYCKMEQQADLIDEINRSGAKMLFVAKGVPLQENWIHDNSAALNVPVILGVGALFDFCAGSVPRAPLIMRKLKLEWLFRLALEPRRLFKRYVIGNPLFVYRAVKDRVLGRSPARDMCSPDKRKG